MGEYTTVAEATRDVRTKMHETAAITHPLASPTVAVVVPAWTDVLSGFEANTRVTTQEAERLDQIRALYDQTSEWLAKTANKLDIGTLNEHTPAEVLFIGLFRDLQARFASKQNLNPHKFAVLFGERYRVTE